MANKNIKKLSNDEHLAFWAAAGCLHPSDNPGNVAMARLIERLVLPADKDEYSWDEMQKYIQEALEKHDRTG